MDERTRVLRARARLRVGGKARERDGDGEDAHKKTQPYRSIIGVGSKLVIRSDGDVRVGGEFTSASV